VASLVAGQKPLEVSKEFELARLGLLPRRGGGGGSCRRVGRAPRGLLAARRVTKSMKVGVVLPEHGHCRCGLVMSEESDLIVRMRITDVDFNFFYVK
jgi:hypothetical protein